MVMSDKKVKSFVELLNGQELDLEVLDWDEITKRFEDYFESDWWKEETKNWKDENNE